MDIDLDQIQKAAQSGGIGSILSGFSPWGLFFGFAFSVVGMWMFKRAKKKGNPALIGISIALMVYPYFVTNPLPCFLVGSGLCFGAHKLWNQY